MEASTTGNVAIVYELTKDVPELGARAGDLFFLRSGHRLPYTLVRYYEANEIEGQARPFDMLTSAKVVDVRFDNVDAPLFSPSDKPDPNDPKVVSLAEWRSRRGS